MNGLDAFMPSLLSLLIDFITSFFATAWPYFFVIMIIAGFTKKLSSLLNVFSKNG
jgi:hypothetical protein